MKVGEIVKILRGRVSPKSFLAINDEIVTDFAYDGDSKGFKTFYFFTDYCEYDMPSDVIFESLVNCWQGADAVHCVNNEIFDIKRVRLIK